MTHRSGLKMDLNRLLTLWVMGRFSSFPRESMDDVLTSC
jgi:hypothetical protein